MPTKRYVEKKKLEVVEVSKVTEVTLELMELIFNLRCNAEAFDEDLPETWGHVKYQWSKIQSIMQDYIVEGES